MSGEELVCPHCGGEIKPDWPFCTHCGVTLEVAPPATLVCEECGAEVGEDETHCPKCGTEFESGGEADSSPSAPVPEPPISTASEVPSETAAAPSTAPTSVSRAPPMPHRPVPSCANCGAPVDAAASSCWRCGSHLGAPEDAPVVSGRLVPPGPPTSGGTTPAPTAAPGILGLLGSPSRRTFVGTLLFALAVALLIGSLVAGWYFVSSTATNGTGQTTASGVEIFYPLNQYSLTLTCTRSSVCLGSSSFTGTYSQGNIGGLAPLYGAVALLVGIGILLGLGSTLLLLSRRGRNSRWVRGFALLAILIVLLAPLTLAAAQPSVLASQGSGAGQTNGGGASPGNSFAGSCSDSGCADALVSGSTVNSSWGPGVGFYLCLVSALAFLLGCLVLGGPRLRSPTRLYSRGSA